MEAAAGDGGRQTLTGPADRIFRHHPGDRALRDSEPAPAPPGWEGDRDLAR